MVRRAREALSRSSRNGVMSIDEQKMIGIAAQLVCRNISRRDRNRLIMHLSFCTPQWTHLSMYFLSLPMVRGLAPRPGGNLPGKGSRRHGNSCDYIDTLTVRMHGTEQHKMRATASCSHSNLRLNSPDPACSLVAQYIPPQDHKTESRASGTNSRGIPGPSRGAARPQRDHLSIT